MRMWEGGLYLAGGGFGTGVVFIKGVLIWGFKVVRGLYICRKGVVFFYEGDCKKIGRFGGFVDLWLYIIT